MYDMGINAQQFKNIDFSNVFCWCYGRWIWLSSDIKSTNYFFLNCVKYLRYHRQFYNISTIFSRTETYFYVFVWG